MEIQKLSFTINYKDTYRTVHIGEKVRIKFECENDYYILEGEIRGAYQEKRDEWCIFILGKYKQWIYEELDFISVHGIYLKYILELEYLDEE